LLWTSMERYRRIVINDQRLTTSSGSYAATIIGLVFRCMVILSVITLFTIIVAMFLPYSKPFLDLVNLVAIILAISMELFNNYLDIAMSFHSIRSISLAVQPINNNNVGSINVIRNAESKKLSRKAFLLVFFAVLTEFVIIVAHFTAQVLANYTPDAILWNHLGCYR
jgi:hypothetical protein